MSVGMASQVGSLPSTQRFLRSVEQDLRSGRSVWVLFPQGGEALRLWDLLLHNLEGPGGMIVAPVDLGTVGSYGPFDVLRSVVEDWEDTGIARFLEDLTLCHQAPEVLLLKSLEEIPPPKRNEWLLAVERWAASSLRHSPERRRKLCVVAAAIPSSKMVCLNRMSLCLYGCGGGFRRPWRFILPVVLCRRRRPRCPYGGSI